MEICKHFGICGGCSLQNLPYESQLKEKAGKVEKLLAPFYSAPLNITPSPASKYFRNKIELSFAHQVVWKEPQSKKKIIRDKSVPLEFENALGFRHKGRWDRCIDLKECILFNEKLPAFVEAVRAWASANNIEYYDQRTHKGVLRNIMLREGKNTNEGMIVLITAAPLEAEGFAELAAAVYPGYSVLTALNTGASDGSGWTDLKVLRGSAVMRESISPGGREIFFELSPFSFFQTNTQAAALMYERVRGIVAGLKPDTLYDLYGGAGSFSLSCSAHTGKSLCVESVPQAVDNGRKNAEINNIENVKFFCDTTEDFLTKNKISAHNSLIILDPPRSGLHPKARKAVAESGVKNILYVSCNPVTLAEDLKTITQSYEIVNAECFDFFPHTDHIETLAELKLK